MSRILKVAALQKRMGGVIPPAVFDDLRDLGVDLACLPEYFFIPDKIRNQTDTLPHRQTILNQLEAFSRRLVGAVVGGTLIEREGPHIYNACHIFDCGRHIGIYRKLNPTSHERSLGIHPGEGYRIFEVRGIRLAPLICADALFPQSFQALAELKPDLIAVPTTSPFRPDDTVEAKFRRDLEIFVAGARAAGAYLVKTCGVGLLMGQRLQGRSLICSPEEIIARVNPRSEALETTLIAALNLDNIRASKAYESRP